MIPNTKYRLYTHGHQQTSRGNLDKATLVNELMRGAQNAGDVGHTHVQQVMLLQTSRFTPIQLDESLHLLQMTRHKYNVLTYHCPKYTSNSFK